MEYVIGAIIGYLLGCFNTAYFISHAKGFDIRDKGSGNAGASNMQQTLGWSYGIMTALTDILKAFLAVFIIKKIYPDNEILHFLTGVMAVMGHIFPFYLKFRGGKGYACYAGMLLALDWKFALYCMLMGALITLILNYIALATMTTAVLVPVHFAFNGKSPIIIAMLAVTAVVIIWKHRSNIHNIINHTEKGLRKKKQTA